MKEIVRIIRYSAELWRYYAAIAVLVVVVAALNLAAPFLTKLIVDDLVNNLGKAGASFDRLGVLVLLILLSNLLITFLTNWNGYLGDLLSVKLNTFLSRKYYRHILKLPLEYFDNEITGRITSRLDRSIATISTLMQTLANNFVQFGLTALITLGVIAIYSWQVAVFLAVLFPSYIWISHLSSREWIKKQEGINQDIDHAHGRFVEAIGQIRVVKAFVQELPEWEYFSGKRTSIEGQTKVQSRQWHKYDIWRRLILNLVFFLIYGFIVWQTYRGRYTLGEMTLLLQLANQAQWPLFGSSFIIDGLQRARAGSKDFFEVMALEPKITDAPRARALKLKQGRLEYSKVNFAYEGGKQVLKDVSFAIEPGTKLALVGESGEGKSTISNLLLRLYEPVSGEILIDEQDISQVTQGSLRANIGVVFQDPALFSGSAAANISYGTNASQKEIERAAKAANAHDFIKKLPKGYNTEIGERGVKLSGGQKQRIAIARAILKNPPILILDEATSSLDSKAEREVQAALNVLMEGRTTMIIAHRLSTISNVDIIVGLKNGRVAEHGRPEELANAGGIYSELLSLQAPTKANKARLRELDIAVR